MKDDSNSALHAETRRLAAIMFTDIVGFSRQMGSDEARTMRLLNVHNQLIQQVVSSHHGHVIKTIGDAFLVEFPSVVQAVHCAQQVHTQLRAHNAEKEKAEQIHVRIGIHLGDIIEQEGDVFGDGVNIAARLQALAEPDTICVSQKVYEEIDKKLSLGAVLSLGQPQLKNIAQRFGVYLLLSAPPKGLRQTLQVHRLKLSRRVHPTLRGAVSLVLLVGALTATWYLARSPLNPQPSVLSPQAASAALPLPDKPSLVVLPFVNMSGDPGQEYFSDGLTEDLTSDLSKISSLFVIARNSAFTYKGKAVKVQDVSKEMGVRYVLEGSVRKSDDQVRVTAQLIDGLTGGHVWSERYDRPFKDIFALQDEIVQKIVTTLKLQLTLWEQGVLVRKTTDNLEAYDYFLRGLEANQRMTQDANTQARQLWEKAAALDPQYALAYAGLSFTYYREWANRWSTSPQALEQAFALAQQALALDDSLPLAHSLSGSVYGQQQQYDQAIAESERAITLDPNNADSYLGQAHVLLLAGRPEEALRSMERALRLNPHFPAVYSFQLGWAYSLMGHQPEAIVAVKESLSRNPNYFAAHRLLAVSYWQQWAFQHSADAQTLTQALGAAQRAVALSDSNPMSHALLSMVYLWQKQYEPATAELERAIALGPTEAREYASLAETLSRIGRPEEALQMVEQALRRPPSFEADFHLNSVGAAYYLSGRPKEAIAPLQRFLSHYHNLLGAHLTLVAVYSELGREAEARAEAAEVLRINPQFSLEVHKQRVPIKDPAMLERHIAALRKAGLK